MSVRWIPLSDSLRVHKTKCCYLKFVVLREASLGDTGTPNIIKHFHKVKSTTVVVQLRLHMGIPLTINPQKLGYPVTVVMHSQAGSHKLAFWHTQLSQIMIIMIS